MLPIKIQCACGQRYSFEVEPVGGRMPTPVACPVCGTDGTAAANAIIAQHYPTAAPPPVSLQLAGAGAAPPAPPPPSVAGQGAGRAGARNRNNGLMVAGIVGGVLAMAALGVLLLLHSRYEPKASGKPAAAAAATGEGENLPQTLEELNQSYPEPPAGQNAAVFFQQGIEALQITDADRNSLNLPLIGKAVLPGQPAPAARTAAIAGFLHRNQKAWELFEQGTRCSQSRYPIDLTQGMFTRLPHLSGVKQAAQLATLAAAAADAKQEGQAADGVLLALAAGRSLENEPVLVSQLVRATCNALAVMGLEQAVNRAPLQVSSFDRLQAAFKAAEERESSGDAFNRAVIAERVSALVLFDTPPDKLREQFAKLSMPSGGRELANLTAKDLKAGRTFCLETLDQVLAARKEPFPARLKSDEIFRQRIAEATAKQVPLVSQLLQSLGGQAAKEAASLAQLRLALTALALEQFRSTHGDRYPDAVTELAPACLAAVLADPFDGQPLRYRKQEGGYLLYSLGPDVQDDGGARLASGKGDLVFAVDRRASSARPVASTQPAVTSPARPISGGRSSSITSASGRPVTRSKR